MEKEQLLRSNLQEAVIGRQVARLAMKKAEEAYKEASRQYSVWEDRIALTLDDYAEVLGYDRFENEDYGTVLA